MAETMQFDLVSPERRLASKEASAVSIPGTDGDLTAMPNHAPFLTTLRPGVLAIIDGSAREEFVVTGGFAELSTAGVSVLAEQAVPVTEFSQEMIDTLVSEAEDGLNSPSDDVKAAAALRINDLKALSAHL